MDAFVSAMLSDQICGKDSASDSGLFQPRRDIAGLYIYRLFSRLWESSARSECRTIENNCGVRLVLARRCTEASPCFKENTCLEECIALLRDYLDGGRIEHLASSSNLDV